MNGRSWLALLGFIALSFGVASLGGYWARQRRPLILFLVQLFLNLIWSGLFFGLRSPALGMLEIVLLWLAILRDI